MSYLFVIAIDLGWRHRCLRDGYRDGQKDGVGGVPEAQSRRLRAAIRISENFVRNSKVWAFEIRTCSGPEM
jgi:hypothetical protein